MFVTFAEDGLPLVLALFFGVRHLGGAAGTEEAGEEGYRGH